MKEPDIDKIAEHYAAILQERTAHLIAEFVENTVEPMGVAVLIDGKHMCAMGRGVRDTHSVMKVNVMHGVFQRDPTSRDEFFQRLATK